MCPMLVPVKATVWRRYCLVFVSVVVCSDIATLCSMATAYSYIISGTVL